jgi:hypothetical protein
MSNEMKKKYKVFYIIPLVLILLLTGVIFYKGIFNKSKLDGNQEVEQFSAVAPTEAVKPEGIEVVTAAEDDTQVYIMDVEDVINSKPVSSEDIKDINDEPYSLDTEDKLIEASEDNVTAIEDNAEDTDKRTDDQKNDVLTDKNDKAELYDEKSAGNNEPSKESEEEIKVIDESPKTIVEENVNEYKGDEKTGTGFSFFDNMPEPSVVEEDFDGDIPAGGKQGVGTW